MFWPRISFPCPRRLKLTSQYSFFVLFFFFLPQQWTHTTKPQENYFEPTSSGIVKLKYKSKKPGFSSNFESPAPSDLMVHVFLQGCTWPWTDIHKGYCPVTYHVLQHFCLQDDSTYLIVNAEHIERCQYYSHVTCMQTFTTYGASWSTMLIGI